MQPVWVLSVDLQTKTATFQSGLSDAAKSARGAFTQIKEGSGEMGREVSGNMMEARHGVILLGEEFGVHLPRGVTSFLASIGPVGAAMEAAFPFLAIAVGATILIEHLAKLHAEGAKLTDDQMKFSTAAASAFNMLDEKLIQAEIRTDELKNDHLGALKLQLELIDKQSMEELARSFDMVAKAAEAVFADLKTSWYQLGAGSEGASHALTEFKSKYEDLLAHGDASGAAGLLTGTLSQAQKILDFQKQYVASQSHGGSGGDYKKFEEASNGLKAMGVGIASTTAGIEKETAAQQQLVDALNEQVKHEQQMADIEKTESANTTRTAQGAMSGEASARAKEAADSQERIAMQGLAGARSIADAQLAIKRASIAERLAVDSDFAKREYDIQVAGNAAQIVALDKMSKDYPNQLKSMHDKALELEATHAARVAAITSKATVAQANKDLQAIEQGEREKIDATQKASAVRLTAINQSIAAEEAAGLQDTNFYRELLSQRVQVTEEMTERQAKLQEAAGMKEAESIEKAGELSLQKDKQAQDLINSARVVSATQRVSQEQQAATALYALKMEELLREEAALDKADADYLNKLQEFNAKEKELTQAHENEMAAIKDKAEEASNAKILAAALRFNDQIVSGLTSVLMRHQSFARMVTSLGDQVVSGMITNAIKEAEAAAIGKEAEAAKAARKAYNIGLELGGPTGMIAGAALAAVAFSTVTGFQGGTDSVPGVGSGDVVPAMLEPGEGVVPKGVMAQLSDMAKNGGLGGGPSHVTHVHYTAHMHASALDADGVDQVFEKHAETIQKHFEQTLRRLNH